ncbi:MAG TPA: hypothetical protein VMA37_11085 [Acetobacteraceae bacterium]|nr:hypothetical protein [Acetobacteraceae bacterium]
MRSKGLIYAAILACGAGLATSAPAADVPTYGVVLKTLANPFWGAMARGITEGAKEAQVKIFEQAANSDQDAET